VGRATRVGAKIRRIQENLRLTRPIVLLATCVLVPVVLSTSVGIVSLVLGKSSKDLVLSVLIISFAAAALGGAIGVVVLLGRRARTARLQSDLLGNVSHELKTPLAAIRLHAQTIQMGPEPEALARCADTIVRETEWLEVTINRLLTWRAAAKDRDNLSFRTGLLAPVGNEVAVRFQSMIAPGDAELAVEIETELPVSYDAGGVQSILLNLLTNAYKYSIKPRRISLSITDGPGEVRLKVKDNGYGISEKDQGRIFQPFYRSKHGRHSGAGGAGLGLAIVDYMVQAHGGKIAVDSTAGVGAEFTVTLPAVDSGGEVT
jgi:signal transduction histidine kinase